MENRKDNYTPCNRIEDSILTQILRENVPSCKGHVHSNTRSNSCTCRRATSDSRRDNSWNRSGEAYTVRRDSYSSNSEKVGSSCKVENDSRRVARCEDNTDARRPCNYNDSAYVNRREESANGECCEKCIGNSCINGYPVAMVYCPDHEFEDLYSCEEALDRGTLFRILDLPFYPGKCRDCR
ncbi:MAG: spore coat associated protein CotJA [Clostridia bacterium]|nr:spore coat associated protein CotJA [Clostridia bacterium]